MSERFETTLPVLGVPVRFLSNARAVVDAAESAFGAWRVLESSPEDVEDRGVTVRIVLHEGDEGDRDDAPISYRFIDGFRFVCHTAGSVGVVDPGRREAVAFVTAALVAERERFRYAFVEGLTLGLLTPLDRQPFHAAAVVGDGAALLLAGPGGTGKSTLAYAALRSGLGILSEDTVFLQSRPSLRVWGHPGRLHLPADARERFPELAAETPTPVGSGERKLVLDLRERDGSAPRPVVDRAGVCVVERSDGGGEALVRLSPEALLERLLRDHEPGFDLFSDTIEEPLSALAAHGGWRMRVPPDPEDAVPLLREMLREVRAGAP